MTADTKNPLTLLQDINNRYLNALALHREEADLFWFIYMPGFAMLHEYHNLSESLVQRSVKRFITTTYHVAIPDILPDSNSSLVAMTDGLNQKKLDAQTIYNLTSKAWEKYVEWEENTLKVYQEIACKLLDIGEISSFNFVGDIIKEVKTELIYINDKMIEFCGINWDMSEIHSMQNPLLERHEKLIRDLLGKSKKYHYHNSSEDEESRTTLLKKYEE